MAECRCCRKPVQDGMLACRIHWFMLPKPIRNAIWSTYRNGPSLDYAAAVSRADVFWKAKGIFIPATPKE